MNLFKRMIDFFTLGSAHPMRRLLAYYAVMAIIVFLLFEFVPYFSRLFVGEQIEGITNGSAMLQDVLGGGGENAAAIAARSHTELALTSVMVMVSTLLLMLPVSWVYMSARGSRFDQSIAQTMLILPVVVAGIVLVVRSSLALAFSLAGIVAALRFRTTLSDARDTVYILLAIGVGLAAGVQVLTVAAVVSIAFNFVVLLLWQYDFGRNVLEPTAASQWAEPLGSLTDTAVLGGGVPDRDLVLALSPKNAAKLAKRFDRIQKILGPTTKKPRFNAVLSVSTNELSAAQGLIEAVLDRMGRRWRLDQVVTNEGKPSELFYLVGVRKNVSRDDLLTAVRQGAGEKIVHAEVELGDIATPKGKKGKSN